MSEIPPPPFGTFQQWGERLNGYLQRVRDKLSFKNADSRASDDGLLLWDPSEDQVVVSTSGEWKVLRYGHSDHAAYYTTATYTAAAANTAYPINWENIAYEQHVDIDGTYPSRIVFQHAGIYQIDFSCELQSNNNSAKSVYIFPRVNGVDIPYSTIKHSIKDSGESKVVSRSGIFTVSDGDYLEAMYAVTDTALRIQGSAATAFSPAAPSATIVISEVKI
jgi:hypothetical protein